MDTFCPQSCTVMQPPLWLHFQFRALGLSVTIRPPWKHTGVFFHKLNIAIGTSRHDDIWRWKLILLISPIGFWAHRIRCSDQRKKIGKHHPTKLTPYVESGTPIASCFTSTLTSSPTSHCSSPACYHLAKELSGVASMQNKDDRGQQLRQWVGLARIPIYCTEKAESKKYSATVVTLNHHSWFPCSLQKSWICSHVGSKWEKGGFIMHAHIKKFKENIVPKFTGCTAQDCSWIIANKRPSGMAKISSHRIFSCCFLRRRLFGTGVTTAGASGWSGCSGEEFCSAGRLVETFFNFLSRAQSHWTTIHYHHFCILFCTCPPEENGKTIKTFCKH